MKANIKIIAVSLLAVCFLHLSAFGMPDTITIEEDSAALVQALAAAMNAKIPAESSNKPDTVTPSDSSLIEVRIPPAEKQDEIFSNKDFLYDKKGEPPSTLWERISQWFNDLMNDLFSTKEGEIFTDVFKYALIAAALVFIIILLLKTDVRFLFYKKSRAAQIEFSELTEDINAIDFDAQIDEAAGKKKYRRAVRLYFLKTLKQLSDKNFIQWKPEKTNYDYFIELKTTQHQKNFRTMSLVYDYVWYGDFTIEKKDFDAASDQFKQFNRHLDN